MTCECGRRLPISSEWDMAVVLPKETQETFVVVVFHGEEFRDVIVIAARLLHPSADKIPYAVLCDFPSHIQRVHRRPERLTLVPDALVQHVRRRSATLFQHRRTRCGAVPHREGELVDRDVLSSSRYDQAFDQIDQFSDVARPRILLEHLECLL